MSSVMAWCPVRQSVILNRMLNDQLRKVIQSMATSSDRRFRFEMSKCSILSKTPKNVEFVKLVIEFAASESDLKEIIMDWVMLHHLDGPLSHRNWGRECVSFGTFVKSLNDKSSNVSDDKFWANSCGIDGSSLPDNRSSRKLGRGSSGTSVSETLVRSSLKRLFSNPMNALSITFNSLLCDKSRLASRGNVAKAASSKRNKRLNAKFKWDSDYENEVEITN